uniref:Uncharacterized protein n=1 Tax=Triticum urartu TaxID=4572 RepID=A0A8R7Q2B7_TRIUA
MSSARSWRRTRRRSTRSSSPPRMPTRASTCRSGTSGGNSSPGSLGALVSVNPSVFLALSRSLLCQLQRVQVDNTAY